MLPLFFVVGRVIQVIVNGFLSNKISLIAGAPQGSVLSSLLFLMYINVLPKPHHRQNSKSQFPDDTALWAASKMYNVQQNFEGPTLTGKVVCQMENKTQSCRNQGHHVLQVISHQKVNPFQNCMVRDSKSILK